MKRKRRNEIIRNLVLSKQATDGESGTRGPRSWEINSHEAARGTNGDEKRVMIGDASNTFLVAAAGSTLQSAGSCRLSNPCLTNPSGSASTQAMEIFHVDLAVTIG